MIEKMYENLQKKYKNSIFQILKIYKPFRICDFSSTIREKNTLGGAVV